MKIKNWMIHKLGGYTIEDRYLDHSSDLVKLYNLSEYNLDIISTNFMYDRYSQHFSTNEIYNILSRQFIPAIKDRMEVECIEDISNGKTIYRGKIIIGTKRT